MRLAKSTLGLRDGYGDRERVKRNEMLPRLQTGRDPRFGIHQADLMTGSPHENTTSATMVSPGISPIVSDQQRPIELGRRKTKLSHKLSIKSFRQWIQNQRGASPIIAEPVNNCKVLGTGMINNNQPDSSIIKVTGMGCDNFNPIGLIKPNLESPNAVQVTVINPKKMNRVSSDLISSKSSSLGPASNGAGDEITTHQFLFPKLNEESNSVTQILASSSPPPPYRSPVPAGRPILSHRHPSLPSVSSFFNPHYLRSPSSAPHLNITLISPPSHLISLPICSNRFGIPCVIDMASNSPPLRQPIPNLLSSSSPLTTPNNQSAPRIPLPARDDLSIAHASSGVGNKVTHLDHKLPLLDNLSLGPAINRIIESSAPVSPAPSSPSSCDPPQPTRGSQLPLSSLINNNPLSSERPLSVVEEDPPSDQVQLNSLAPEPKPCNGLSPVSMLEPNPPSLSLTNPSLSTIHPNQIITSENMTSSPTRSPVVFSPDSNSPIPDRLPSSGPCTHFIKSAPTTKVDVSHKHGETHVAVKPPAPVEKKSVFGKLFDRRTDIKSAGVVGSASTEGSGNESESNTLGTGTGVKKSIARKGSTKAGVHIGDASSNPGSATPNEPEGISGPRLMVLQGSIAPQHLGGKPKGGSERSGDDKPFVGSSKLRDMVGGKLGRKPSSSKGGRSEDGKSDDGENRSRAGSQATTSLLKKYGVCEKAAIGKGATAVVRLAHKWDRGTDKLYAVKEFRKRRKNESEKEYVKKLTSEFCISSTLHHENIVETVDLVQDENQHWCEVMEYCPGGDLYAAIKRGSMKQQEINSYFKQLLNGIAYLHQMGVAHRDIKPENLLLDGKGRIKITDFGVSDVFRMCWEKTAHLSKGLCGSEPYLPKEIFERKEYDARLVDVWSCGIVYYCCCIQELPWRVAKKSDASYMSFVESYESSLTPTPLINLTKDSRKIIKKMLHPEPEGRVQIEDVLQDEWITSLQVLAV